MASGRLGSASLSGGPLIEFCERNGLKTHHDAFTAARGFRPTSLFRDIPY